MRLRALRDRLAHYLYEEVDPTSLALVRILFGSFMCLSALRLLPWVELLFAEDGVRYSVLVRGAPSTPVAWTLYGSMLACMLLFTLGVKSRWMARLTLALYGYHYLLALAAVSAVVDRLQLIFLTIAAFAELDGRFALLPERPAAKVSAWPARLFSLQLFFLYTGAALWKCTFADWRGGEMLRETLSSASAGPLAFTLSRAPLPAAVWHVLTWAVIAGEFALGILYLRRRSAPVAIVLACGFHGAVAILLRIQEFWICLSVAPAALDPARVAERWDALIARCRAHFGRSP